MFKPKLLLLIKNINCLNIDSHCNSLTNINTLEAEITSIYVLIKIIPSDYDSQIKFWHDLLQFSLREKKKVSESWGVERDTHMAAYTTLGYSHCVQDSNWSRSHRTYRKERHFRDYIPTCPERIDPKTIRHFLSLALFWPNVQSQWEPMKNSFMQFQKLILLFWTILVDASINNWMNIIRVVFNVIDKKASVSCIYIKSKLVAVFTKNIS